MAEDSVDEPTVMIQLDQDTYQWLTSQAAEKEVDEEAIIKWSLAAQQVATDLDGELDGSEMQLDVNEEYVEKILRENTNIDEEMGFLDALDEDEFESLVVDKTREIVQERVENSEEIFTSELEQVNSELLEIIEATERKLDEKIEETRKRVVQVKRETDQKAENTHTHSEFQHISRLEDKTDEMQAQIEELAADMDELKTALPAGEIVDEASIRPVKADVEEIENRLLTVARIVNNLREAVGSSKQASTLRQLKAKANTEGTTEAACENCRNSVNLGLLTKPVCPNCEEEFTALDPSSGLFSKATLEVDDGAKTDPQALTSPHD